MKLELAVRKESVSKVKFARVKTSSGSQAQGILGDEPVFMFDGNELTGWITKEEFAKHYARVPAKKKAVKKAELPQ